LPGETWRVRTNALTVTLEGAVTISTNSTIEIAGGAVQQKAGASLTLTLPEHARLIVRDGGSLTCDRLVLAPGSQLEGNGAINAAIAGDVPIPETIQRHSPQGR
jgi:hypothetical protein